MTHPTSPKNQNSPAKRRCHRCHGAGRVACQICGGAGQVPRGTDVFGNRQFDRCSGCFGIKSTRCSACGGEGFT